MSSAESSRMEKMDDLPVVISDDEDSDLAKENERQVMHVTREGTPLVVENSSRAESLAGRAENKNEQIGTCKHIYSF